jgi:hypothetical protein
MQESQYSQFHSLFGRKSAVRARVIYDCRIIYSFCSKRVEELKEKSEEYLRVRRVRARVTEICREILAMLDQTEKLRREEFDYMGGGGGFGGVLFPGLYGEEGVAEGGGNVLFFLPEARGSFMGVQCQ